MSQAPRADLREQVLRALNKIKKPSTAEEITELLNRELDPGDRPFQPRAVATWLRHANDKGAQSLLAGNSPAEIELFPFLDRIATGKSHSSRLHNASKEMGNPRWLELRG